tara:strand:+ start:51154 stop:52845 length:1692 start_codon:yes stop_codon:yes gene_type:complete
MDFNEWFIFFLLLNLIIFLGTRRLFKLAKIETWKSIIPVYNIIKICEIINRPKWWVVLAFIPVINLLIIPVIWVELIKYFNHNSKGDRILVILTLGFYIFYVSYFSKKTKYIDNINFSSFEKSVGSFVFAIIIATIVHNYIIQPFVIPTGSLEKTLRVGDFLLVSKFHYGARIPSTVLTFPMVHDTIPVLKTRSYLKKPQLPYMRIPGFQKIKNNDIVVFNWPADTVRKFFVKEKGVFKPIDKRSNYVKRAVGIPGDTLEIKDGIIYINGKENILPDRAKPLFSYEVKSKEGVSSNKLLDLEINGFIRKFIIKNLSQEAFDGISNYVINLSRNGDSEYLIYTFHEGIPIDMVRKLNLDIREIIDTNKKLNLTYNDALKIRKSREFDSIYRLIDKPNLPNLNFFPNNYRFNWNNDQFGPIIIPKSGEKIDLDINTLPLYKKLITDYELNELKTEGNNILINGEKTNNYVFKQDYYWMMGDNRYNSEDSRVWGFVPFDHVLGKPVFIWMSIEGLFNGIENWRFRFDRIFTTIGFDGEPRSYLPHFLILIFIWQIFVMVKKRKNKN